MATLPTDPKWHCRIGNIRPKAGGATLRVFDSNAVREIAEVGRWLEVLPQRVREVFPEGLIGAAMVVWSGDGSSKPFYSVGNHSPIPWRLVPAYVHDRLSEEVNQRNARDAANEVIDERFIR